MKLNRTKVLHADYDEADSETPNRVIITTKQGWAFQPSADERSALHVQSFEDHREANARMKRVERCYCARCTGPTDEA